MGHLSAVYQQYRQLVARVEAFGEAIRQRYPEHMTCHAGCDGCCYQQFTIFPVEAYHLQQAVQALPVAIQQRLYATLQAPSQPWHIVDEPQPCVLLDNGRCQVYAGRPLICRIHGYPLYSSMIERPDGVQRDCCPLNFSTLPLQDIATQAIYNLDLVNQTLTAINHLFVQASDRPGQRLTIRQAVLAALAPACESVSPEEKG